MDEFLDQFDKVPTSQKVLLLLLVLAGVFVAFYLLAYSPMEQEIAQKTTERGTLNTQIAERLANQGDLDDVRQSIAELCIQKAQFEQALPRESDIPDLLDSVTEFARVADLEIHLFRPQPFTPTAEGYMAVPVEMQVSGTYNDILGFFDSIARQPRIINVRGVALNPSTRRSETEGEQAYSSQLKVSAPRTLVVETQLVTYFSEGGDTGPNPCDDVEIP